MAAMRKIHGDNGSMGSVPVCDVLFCPIRYLAVGVSGESREGCQT